ncbi:MAG: hypothetical protein DCC64_03500 [Planctomycetota bacterium]|nr:MAG: hypothetical protein DCC64_03500 [Planctomycetota bacterium]
MADLSDNRLFEGLRSALLRADRVADFALRMSRGGGQVPAGLVGDFLEARVALEREFVKCHDRLSPDLRARLKELILKTKNLKPEVMAQGAERLVERIRGVLNDLMIDGGLPLSLTQEMFEETSRQSSLVPAPTAPEARPKDVARVAPSPRAASFGPVILVAVLLLAGLAAAAAAWAFGLFEASPANSAVGNVARVGNQPAPVLPRPANAPPADNAGAFDAKAAGYTRELKPQAHYVALNLLDPDFDLAVLRATEWPSLLLSLEEDLARIEPARLKLGPADTWRRLLRFAEGAAASDAAWRSSRKPFLDSFVAHCRQETQVVLFPDGDQVLPSDILHAKGGPRLPLILLLCALAQASGADLVVIAPMGREFPLLAQTIKAGIATYDGEQLGLRSSAGKEPAVREMLAALIEKLRPTLATPAARVWASSLIFRCLGDLSPAQAREALADLDLATLSQPAPGDPQRREPYDAQRAAVKLLQPAICRVLLDRVARGDAAEAARLLELALAVADAASVEQALLLLAERAQKGAQFRGEPLPLVVARQLLARGDKAGAQGWFKRAFEEAPDHAAAALELAALAENADLKRYYLRSAYARGCRAPDFLRELAGAQAQAGELLSALALLDELCAQEAGTVQDLADAALLCLALERPAWAQERIAASRHAREPAILRLDLIAEIALHGLSDRARALAQAYGRRGQDDPYIESLLSRLGG